MEEDYKGKKLHLKCLGKNRISSRQRKRCVSVGRRRGLAQKFKFWSHQHIDMKWIFGCLPRKSHRKIIIKNEKRSPYDWIPKYSIIFKSGCGGRANQRTLSGMGGKPGEYVVSLTFWIALLNEKNRDASMTGGLGLSQGSGVSIFMLSVPCTMGKSSWELLPWVMLSFHLQ